MFRTGSIEIGRPFGIPLRIHWSFFGLLAFLMLSGASLGGMAGAIGVAIQFGLLMTFVTLHELGHSLTATRVFGVPVRSITLWPLGGIAEIGGGGQLKPSAEFWITAAGPAVNLAIAAVVAPFAALAWMSAGWTLPVWIVGANLALGLFNLIPAFPMDGGRLLRAFLAYRRRDHLRATETAVEVGKFIAIGMGFLGLFVNPWLIAIAIFAWTMGQRELLHARQVAAHGASWWGAGSGGFSGFGHRDASPRPDPGPSPGPHPPREPRVFVEDGRGGWRELEDAPPRGPRTSHEDVHRMHAHLEDLMRRRHDHRRWV